MGPTTFFAAHGVTVIAVVCATIEYKTIWLPFILDNK
jgi:hypothetical protein